MTITISRTELDVAREPFVKPFGFKGHSFCEKWLCKVGLTNDTGQSASGLGGLAVLWSDQSVFTAHTEVGGNLIMASVLEHALQAAKGMAFDTPLDLLDMLIGPTYAYACRITDNAKLRKTFALNALVGLDNAAWMLYGLSQGITTFDQLLPAEFRPVLSARHDVLACVPTLSFNDFVDEVAQLVDSGHFILKIKIGSPGDPEQMLEADIERIRQIHEAVADRTTPHTTDGRIRYYLDANGRYPSVDMVQRLLDKATSFGMLDQIAILEEPLPEDVEQSVADLGVTVAADESLHDPKDVSLRAQLGYGALALKPAGKTFGMTLRMAREAQRLNMPCFVADSACTPRLMDWNRNVAARLTPFPGLKTGMIESNGPQHYARWDQLLAEHPCANATWLEATNGLFNLTESFYTTAGGVLTPDRPRM